MYNLIVSHLFAKRPEGAFEFPRDRFLEYTDPELQPQLRALSNEIAESMTSWPSILMNEGRGQERAYVCRIFAVHASTAIVKFSATPIPTAPRLTNSRLWKLRVKLGIEQFEFNRNHWAVKSEDVLAVLQEAGSPIDDSLIDSFGNMPLPAPPRSQLMAAQNQIAQWDHQRIDDFLLEHGVTTLRAARTLGDERARAHAIVKFAIENPEVVTAENKLFSICIVKEARPSKPSLPADQLKETRDNAFTGSSNRVFVVHGQDERAQQAVASYLKELGMEPVILHEQPNMGRHLLTKFIDEAELATFAVILMTDDDEGAKKGEAPAPRARQNVILELGYFLSHLGQKSVCALVTPGIETPSDFDGIVYVRMAGDGRWKLELRRELLAAGMPVTAK